MQTASLQRFSGYRTLIWFIGLALLLCATEAWIVQSHYFPQKPDLFSLGITLDIVLGLPTLYYVFVVHRKTLPAVTLVPVFVVALLLAGYILPTEHHTYLAYARQAVPLGEIVVVGFIVVQMRQVVRLFKELRSEYVYVIDAVEATFYRVFGKSLVISIVLTEFTLLYYSVFAWRKQFMSEHKSIAVFRYHTRGGYPAILGVLLLCVVVETAGLHVLVQQWSHLAAWILTALSVYSALWLCGDFNAMRLNPITLTQERLYLRTGLRWRADIDRANIAEIRVLTTADKRNIANKSSELYKALRITPMGDARLLLTFSQPTEIHGLFGIRKHTRYVALSVDDERRFLTALHDNSTTII